MVIEKMRSGYFRIPILGANEVFFQNLHFRCENQEEAHRKYLELRKVIKNENEEMDKAYQRAKEAGLMVD